MLAVNGIYEGGKIKLLETVKVKKTQKVVITFLESEDTISSSDISKVAIKGGSFDFLKTEEELYTEADLKVKYR